MAQGNPSANGRHETTPFTHPLAPMPSSAQFCVMPDRPLPLDAPSSSNSVRNSPRDSERTASSVNSSAGMSSAGTSSTGTSPINVRRATLHALAATSFDVVVVGGGITGAGVAREAALAGLATALIERDDFASGTSSRSSRLVHGGVRYLEHGHLALVFESSRERRVLLDIAPHLVRPLAFTWPVWKGARVPLWKVRAGLTLYDALSLFRNVRAHEALSAADVLAREPALRADDLTGGARYWDAATDDTRLTLASAVAAQESGAVVVNHVTVTSGVRRGAGAGARLCGVTVRDALTGDRFDVSARVVVNATGPWSDATAALTDSASHAPNTSQIMGSAGAHIAVPRHRMGNNEAVTLVSPLDGRVMFVLPAGAHAIIGTTERPVTVGPDEIRATESEVQYLLRSANGCFPHASLSMDDVVAAWAGIRPLAAVRAGRHGANSASREHTVNHRDDGLVSVTGGKLTTFRAMAADVLAHAMREANIASGSVQRYEHLVAPRAGGRRLAPQSSAHALFPGGDIDSPAVLLRSVHATVRDAAVAERLAMAYGSRWRIVWRYATDDAKLAERIVADLPYIAAEVAYAVEHELACTLADVFIRRTHIAFETRDHGQAAVRRMAAIMASRLDWSDVVMAQQLAAYDSDVRRLFSIDMV